MLKAAASCCLRCSRHWVAAWRGVHVWSAVFSDGGGGARARWRRRQKLPALFAIGVGNSDAAAFTQAAALPTFCNPCVPTDPHGWGAAECAIKLFLLTCVLPARPSRPTACEGRVRTESCGPEACPPPASTLPSAPASCSSSAARSTTQREWRCGWTERALMPAWRPPVASCRSRSLRLPSLLPNNAVYTSLPPPLQSC